MARRFLVDAQALETGALDPRQSRHAAQVLRLGPGETVELVDGQGREWSAVLSQVTPRAVLFSGLAPRPAAAEPGFGLTLGLGLIQPARMDQVVEQAVQLGLACLVPLTLERSAAHLSRPGPGRLDRWRRIAAEGLKQCARSRPPQITAPMELADFLTLAGPSGLKLVFHPGAEMGLRRLWERAPHASSAACLVGPEGGLTPAELDLAVRQGFARVCLGPRTLRAETAASAAMSACQALWGDLG